MNKVRKRLLSIVMTIVMVLGLVCGMGLKVQAWEGNPYTAYEGTNRTVIFNDMEWYIIKDESTAADAGTLTLFAKEQIGCSAFQYNNSGYKYSSSYAKQYVDACIHNYFSKVADAIVTIPSLTTNGFESTEIYDTATDVKLYLLSTEEFNEITNEYVRKCPDAYNGLFWLRSPGNSDNHVACVYGSTGYLEAEGWTGNYTLGIRPALKLDLSKVIFSSESKTFSLKPPGYSVTLSGGANAVADPSTGTSQYGLTGAMTTVTYEAISGYHFKEFSDITNNGITVTRTSDTKVTVSGTPTADTAITVPNAVERAYADFVNTTNTVKFNDIDWYIIADDSTDADTGTITLLAKDPIGASKFNDNTKDNLYSSSTVKTYLDGMTAEGGAFEGVAHEIVTIPSLVAQGSSSSGMTDTVENVKLYLLSTEEADAITNADVRKCSTASGSNFNIWWLRSPGSKAENAAAVTGNNGVVVAAGYQSDFCFGVRPALKLDLSRVIFSSESMTFSSKQAHAWDEGVVTKEATCTEKGIMTYTCTCGETKTEEINLKAHTLTKVPAKDATVSAEGNKEYYICSVCEKWFEDAAGTKEITDHSSVVIPKLVPPTASPEPTATPEVTPTAEVKPSIEPTSSPEPTPTPDITRDKNDISPSNPVKVDEIEKTILNIKDEKDTKGSTFTLLKAKGTPKSKKSIKLSWSKVPGAEEYIIYGNKCGKKNKYQKIATVKGTSYTAKKLKKGTYYKYTIVAVKGDEAIATSKAIHVVTDGGKKGNNTKVKLSKTKLSLAAGKSKKIKATLKYNKKVASHRKVAWESDNVSIATVKNGKITAVGKGTCYVYAYAQNGVSAKIKITVK